MNISDIPYKKLKEIVLLEIFRDIKSKALNITKTEEMLQLADKFPKYDLSRLLQFEYYKRVLEIYNLARPLLELYGEKIERFRKEPEDTTIFDAMDYLQKVMKALYKTLMKLDLLPKPKKVIPAEEKIEEELSMF